MQTDHTENVVRRDVGGMVTAAVFILIAVIALWDTTNMVDADSFVFPRAVAIAMIIFCMLLIAWGLIRPIIREWRSFGPRGLDGQARQPGRWRCL